MKVINLFAGPGSGKSTLAAEVFSTLKKLDQNIELVTEYAKELVWDDREPILKDQLYVLAKQNRKLARLNHKVDWAITDSPLLLCASYSTNDYYPSFKTLCFESFVEYDNINYYLNRSNTNYSEIGRRTDVNAKVCDQLIQQSLIDYNIAFKEINHNNGLSTIIADCISLDPTILIKQK